MGTASFAISKYSRNRGSGAGSVISSDIRTSGAFATSTTAANLQDGGGAVSMGQGEVLQIHADEAMRVRFGGTAATASTGLYIPASTMAEIECNNPGVVSIIDVA